MAYGITDSEILGVDPRGGRGFLGGCALSLLVVLDAMFVLGVVGAGEVVKIIGTLRWRCCILLLQRGCLCGCRRRGPEAGGVEDSVS